MDPCQCRVCPVTDKPRLNRHNEGIVRFPVPGFFQAGFQAAWNHLREEDSQPQHVFHLPIAPQTQGAIKAEIKHDARGCPSPDPQAGDRSIPEEIPEFFLRREDSPSLFLAILVGTDEVQVNLLRNELGFCSGFSCQVV